MSALLGAWSTILSATSAAGDGETSYGSGTVTTPGAVWPERGSVTASINNFEQRYPQDFRPAGQAPNKKGRKGKWQKLKAWWKTRGREDVTSFVSSVGQAVGELKASRRAARSSVTDFAQDMREAYEDAQDQAGGRPRDGARRQAFPWWIIVLLALLAAIVLVLLARKDG